MATFRVGQRARYVAYTATSMREVPLGSIVTIIPHLGWKVRGKDGAKYSPLEYRANFNGYIFQCDGWQLEPLQDDGRKVVSWSECLWQPSPECVT